MLLINGAVGIFKTITYNGSGIGDARIVETLIINKLSSGYCQYLVRRSKTYKYVVRNIK